MSHSQTNYAFELKGALFGLQTLFIAIGALVMVPLLTGMDPNVALFTAGAGTLVFQFVTKGKIPAFLGSSFAFIPPTIFGISHWGLPATLSGLAAGGFVYFVLSALILAKGKSFIDRILPAIITGPVICGIGLILAPVAVNMAMGKAGDGSAQLMPQNTALILASISLTATIVTRLFARGQLRLVPILVGVIAGYLASLYIGVIDFTNVTQASWLAVPQFVTPTWHWGAVILILPIAAVSAIEHIGDIIAISAVTKQDLVENPGLHRSLIGDGLATTLAGCLGGPPNTTYSEVSAGIAITKTYNPGIMTWSCIFAIGLSFIGKVGYFMQSIPAPVMGGIMILLFGAIAVTGLNLLVEARTDLMKPRNMTIVGIILVIPVGGLSLGWHDFALSGIGLGGLIGVALNLILPMDDEEAQA